MAPSALADVGFRGAGVADEWREALAPRKRHIGDTDAGGARGGSAL